MNELERLLRETLHDPVRSREAPGAAEVAPTHDPLRSDGAARRPSWVPAALASAMAALLLVVGIVTWLDGSDEDGPAAPATAPLPRPSAERDAAIYVAALERFLRPGEREWPARLVAYVVAGAEVQAGLNMRDTKTTIDRAVQTGISDALQPSVTIRWIRDSASVLEPVRDPELIRCNRIAGGDLVVTLDVLSSEPTNREEVSIAASGYDEFDRECTTYWLNTYVVERVAGGWEVTGTTVPMAVS